jgi:hypothetical protein
MPANIIQGSNRYLKKKVVGSFCCIILILESNQYEPFASLKIDKKGRNCKIEKKRSINETQEELFSLKFLLKLLKSLFSGKIKIKKIKYVKIYQIVEKKIANH